MIHCCIDLYSAAEVSQKADICYNRNPSGAEFVQDSKWKYLYLICQYWNDASTFNVSSWKAEKGLFNAV